MARFIIAPFLVAVATAAFAVAAEGRVVHPILAPLNATSALNASSIVDGVVLEGRKLTGEEECAWTCGQVTYKRLCLTLTKMPEVTSPRSLLEAAVRVSLGKANMAKRKFTEVVASSHEGNPMASILESCSKSYDDLVDALEQVQQSIDAHDTHANLVSKMSAASEYAGNCGEWFGERDIPSPYESLQRHVARVVSNTLGILSHVNQV